MKGSVIRINVSRDRNEENDSNNFKARISVLLTLVELTVFRETTSSMGEWGTLIVGSESVNPQSFLQKY